MKTSLKPPYIEKVEQRDDLQIWIVDGAYIRGHIDEEFTNFGQHYRYSYIPKNEFWIDREAKNDEQRFFIDHLLTEHHLMAKGVPYEKAIEEADRVERRERRRAGDLSRMTMHGRQLPDPVQVHERLWKKLENGISAGLSMAVWFAACSISILRPADTTTFMNLCRKTRSGLIMISSSRSTATFFCTSFTNAIEWLPAGLTAGRTPNPVCLKAAVVITPTSCMMPSPRRAGHN